MGLIDFLPMFRVEVDGKNISKALAPRMSSLTVTDGAGVQSDQVTMTLIPRHFRSYVDEAWLITRAVHTLDSGGYRTSIAAEPVAEDRSIASVLSSRSALKDVR